ncbi:hypothetical protein EMIHUDRAFT_113424 [Emiliania huxleyi CCMP1516]|uniref:Methyltransferase FkbM domain-containing protein n=2 Tax=Emiliania huxleyi TaxID=2903 RepID=A0A0D3K367_EMIH1|nr:hypothetical protein EMIHUDRAFT_113424 [Emiliania huxleyi CCMP1516]EOD30202.1 hypothetical protein EMIHUDRAFT_113424 [Emiliania huxleyi CCMP1516]|eukprot:XP_005782631.1 hypothetical protein EMIHUDRAFT_113424 [Emiliania huxleyi CCMP1516]
MSRREALQASCNSTGLWVRPPEPTRRNTFLQSTNLLSIERLVKDVCNQANAGCRSGIRLANFGAGEYLTSTRNVATLDPVNKLLLGAGDARALLVDPDANRLHKAARALPASKVVALNEYATPGSVRSQLQRAGLVGVPLSVLKIDIDSFDCDLLAATLAAGTQPRVIVLEANVKFPPKLRFSAHFDARVAAGSRLGKPWGCSLAYQHAVLRDYELLHLDTLDSVHVLRSVWPFARRPCSVRQTYEAGFAEPCRRAARAGWLGDFEQMRPVQAMCRHSESLLKRSNGSKERLLVAAREELMRQDEKQQQKGTTLARWTLEV